MSATLTPRRRAFARPRLQGSARLLAFVAIYGLFQWIATALHSDRGEAGVVVSLVVVTAILCVETWLSGVDAPAAARLIGLGHPELRGIAVSGVICAVLLIAMAAFVAGTGIAVTRLPASAWQVAGVFAQAGIAEETLFRGYLFGHLRRHSTFWRSWSISMVPFVAVHLWLFLSMPWPIALASIALAAAISVPLAQLFELGGRTIWPAALLHFVIQSVPKLVTVSETAALSFALGWMAVSAVIPLVSTTTFARRAIGQRPEKE